MVEPRLSLSRSQEHWRLLGRNNEADIVSISGRLGLDSVDEQRWELPPDDIAEVQPLTVWHGAVLTVETQSVPWWLERGSLWRWAAVV